MLRIAIIIGSTRPGRKGEAVGKWTKSRKSEATPSLSSWTSKTSTCRNAMLDQVMAWGGALKPLREKRA